MLHSAWSYWMCNCTAYARQVLLSDFTSFSSFNRLFCSFSSGPLKGLQFLGTLTWLRSRLADVLAEKKKPTRKKLIASLSIMWHSSSCGGECYAGTLNLLINFADFNRLPNRQLRSPEGQSLFEWTFLLLNSKAIVLALCCFVGEVCRGGEKSQLVELHSTAAQYLAMPESWLLTNWLVSWRLEAA